MNVLKSNFRVECALGKLKVHKSESSLHVSMTQPMFLRCLSDINWYFCRKINLIFVQFAFFQKCRIFDVLVSSAFNRKLGSESKLGWFGLFSSLKSLNQTRLVFSLEIGKREATLRILKGPRWEDGDVSLNPHAAGRGKLIDLKIWTFKSEFK